MSTARDEILRAFVDLEDQFGRKVFTVQEILHAVQTKGTDFSESTLRTHITSRLCANAPNHHATVYNDFERVGRGKYRLVCHD